MNLNPAKAAVSSVRNFFHVQGPHALPPAVSEVVVKGAVRGLPLDQGDLAVLQAAGGLGDVATGGRKAADVIADAPKNGIDELLGSIRDAARARLGGLVLEWKDKHFPQKLDMVLEKQREALESLTKLLVSKNTHVRQSKEDLVKIEDIANKIAKQIDDAKAAGDDQLANQLTTQKGRVDQELGIMREKVRVAEESLKQYSDEYQKLQNNLEISTANVGILKREHAQAKQLQDLDKKAREAHDSMIDISSDIQRLDQRLAEYDRAAASRLKELNDRIISTKPGAPTVPTTPATPTTPPAA